MKSTTRKTVALDSDVAKAAIQEASADSRTLSNFVNKLLRERFEMSSTPPRKPRAGKGVAHV